MEDSPVFSMPQRWAIPDSFALLANEEEDGRRRRTGAIESHPTGGKENEEEPPRALPWLPSSSPDLTATGVASWFPR